MEEYIEQNRNAMEMVGSRIVARIRVDKILYPKSIESMAQYGYYCFVGKIVNMMQGSVPWDVLNFSRDGKFYLLKFVGNCPSLVWDKEYEITAKLLEGKGKYKETYSYTIEAIESTLDLDKQENLQKFIEYTFTPNQQKTLLSSGLDLVRVFEEEDVESLTKLKGIGEVNVLNLFKRYKESKSQGAAFVKLHSEFGLSQALSKKILATYNSSDIAIEKIQENPYCLIRDVWGIGWSAADGIAYKLGIKDEDPRRIRAFILHFLNSQAESKGDTWVSNQELVEAIVQIAPNIDKETLVGCVQDAIAENDVFYEAERHRIGLEKYRDIETRIALEIRRLQDGSQIEWQKVEESIAEAEQKSGFSYTDEQKNAIKMVLENKVCIISGLAGTGKTSTMFPLRKIFDKNRMRIGLCAFSGKASLNLANVVGVNGRTVHRLLGKKPDERISTYGAHNPLSYDVIILDEVSMIGEGLFLELLQAIKDGGVLVMLGDTAQLEPIDVGSVLHDMVNSGTVPFVELTKIHRQGLKSAIITEAHAVRNRKSIVSDSFSGSEIRGELQDLKIESARDVEDCGEKIVSEFESIYSSGKISIEDILVVTAKRTQGAASCYSLNKRIQALCNPPAEDKEEVSFSYMENGHLLFTTFRVGDRIIVNENMYRTKTVEGNEEPIFNGNIGTVLSASWAYDPESDEKAPVLRIRFPQGEFILQGRAAARNISLGYAITCHKAQGSGYPYILVAVDPSAYIMMNKEWLYTAITRAKKYCYLVGTVGAIQHACKTTQVYSKRTWLAELLLWVQENWDSLKDEVYAERALLQLLQEGDGEL